MFNASWVKLRLLMFNQIREAGYAEAVHQLKRYIIESININSLI